jgi:hypothetical protein
LKRLGSWMSLTSMGGGSLLLVESIPRTTERTIWLAISLAPAPRVCITATKQYAMACIDRSSKADKTNACKVRGETGGRQQPKNLALSSFVSWSYLLSVVTHPRRIAACSEICLQDGGFVRHRAGARSKGNCSS